MKWILTFRPGGVGRLMALAAVAVLGGGAAAGGQTMSLAYEQGKPPVELTLDRPRLLVTKAQLPGLRETVKRRYPGLLKAYADGLDRLAAPAGAKGPGAAGRPAQAVFVNLALVYQITGDNRFAQPVKEFVRQWIADWHAKDVKAWQYLRLGAEMRDLTFALDLVWEEFTPEERKALLRQLLSAAVRYYNAGGGLNDHYFVTLCLLACYGKEADECGVEYRGALAGTVRSYRESFVGYFRLNSGRRGGEAIAPWGECSCPIAAERYVLLAWANCSGEGVLKEPLARGLSLSMLYHMYPGIYHDRENRLIVTWRRNRKDKTVPLPFPARTGSPLDQHYVNHFHRDLIDAASRPAVGVLPRGQGLDGSGMWYFLAGLYDPADPAVTPEDLPETACLDGLGIVSMRSSWRPDATFALFRAGKWFGGGARLNNLAFYIHKEVPLTCQPQSTKPVLNLHNIVTVHNPAEGRPVDKVTLNDAGQEADPKGRLRMMPPGDEHWAGAISDQAAITGFRTTSRYDYVAGDGTRSYPASTVSECTRQFVFVKPDHFVIFDRVTAVKAEFPKRWNLHFLEMNEPHVAGGGFAAAWTGRHSPTDWKYKYHNIIGVDKPAGTLFGRTLLPTHPKIEKIRISTDPADVGNRLFGGPFTADEYVKKIGGSGGWTALARSPFFKLEIAPAAPAARDLFLHVLQASKAGVAGMVPCEPVERGGRVGARLALAGGPVEVLFDKDGALGGSISIAGQPVEFPRQVVDSYKGWADDPRYPRWTTDPRFDIVIPPADRSTK